ncbi:MAG: alpha/beta hydrolase [Candidatus Binataceae bacterium]|nr:alpha/beta hydrolase [Candidatus Binataceae bacterium]
MRIQDYPPQEPLSEPGQAFAAEVMKRGGGVSAEDHSYGRDPYQSLALCVPQYPNGTVAAFAHGGGWTSGYKEHLLFMAPVFNHAGIIFASIGYRLAPQHLFPAGYNDVADGIAWLFRNVSRYGGKPERIFIGGHSAGGHYAALLAVRRDWQQNLGLPRDVVRGCLPISGVYDFREGSGLLARPRFLGPSAAGIEATVSPICNIQGTPPPFLLSHGSEDFPHLSRQAEQMEPALRAAGGSVERIVLAGRNHFSACFAGGEAEGPWAPHALKWISRQ